MFAAAQIHLAGRVFETPGLTLKIHEDRKWIKDGLLISIAVIPNRGSVKRCQGCRQILTLKHFVDVLLIRVPQIVIFIRCRQFFFKQGAANQKRLKNTKLLTKSHMEADRGYQQKCYSLQKQDASWMMTRTYHVSSHLKFYHSKKFVLLFNAN